MLSCSLERLNRISVLWKTNHATITRIFYSSYFLPLTISICRNKLLLKNEASHQQACRAQEALRQCSGAHGVTLGDVLCRASSWTQWPLGFPSNWAYSVILWKTLQFLKVMVFTCSPWNRKRLILSCIWRNSNSWFWEAAH